MRVCESRIGAEFVGVQDRGLTGPWFRRNDGSGALSSTGAQRRRVREARAGQRMTERSPALHHIIPLLPKVGDVQQPGEIIYHSIGLVCSMSDLELERLEGEVPAGETAVVVLHGVHPGQNMMVGPQVELPP